MNNTDAAQAISLLHTPAPLSMDKKQIDHVLNLVTLFFL